MIIFAVVTKIPPPGDRGNLATAVGNVFLYPQVKGDHSFPDTLPALGAALGQPMLDLYVQTPVFRLGEILVLGGDGRDQFGRKPDKWSVEVELFTDADEAANRAREVLLAAGGLSMNADPRQPSRLPYAAPSITEPIILADLWCGAVEGLTDRMLFSAYIHEDHPPHVHVRLIDFSNDQQHYEWDVCNTNGDELTERVVWEFVHEAMVHAEPLRPATLAPSPALRARLAAAGLGPAAN